jgi:hypothetical protein
MSAWKLVALLYIILIGVVGLGHCATQDEQVHKFAVAVARTEGFYANKHTIPARLHNPGDICTSLPHAYPGQTGLYRGYAVFKSDQWGWAALENQIRRVIDGTSTKYTQSMTLWQVARVYAENWKYWGKSVATILHVAPTMTFEEYFDLAPKVRMAYASVWLPAGRNTMPELPTLSQVSPQIFGEGGRLLVPLS